MGKTRSNLIQSICSAITQIKLKDTPLIVGITGIDTSGKSRLTEEVEDYLRNNKLEVQTIHVDDFHYPISKRYNDELSEPDQYYELSIDFNAIKNTLLQPIKKHRKLNATLQHLDLVTDSMTVSKNYNITQNTIVLIEGVFLYRNETRPFIDFFIYLDISEEIAIQRAQIRDVPIQGEEVIRKYFTKYLPAQRRYMLEFHPDQVSEIVIENSNLDNPKIRNWPNSISLGVPNYE